MVRSLDCQKKVMCELWAQKPLQSHLELMNSAFKVKFLFYLFYFFTLVFTDCNCYLYRWENT